MRTIIQEELAKIVEQHQHWIKEDCEGWEDMKANLRRADLIEANLRRADLIEADLSEADLIEADLSEADLIGANLRGANLIGANLYGANLSEEEKLRLGKVLDEPLTGYKKTKEGVVITAEIPKGAIVFCINGSKCRTNRAKITDMEGHRLCPSRKRLPKNCRLLFCVPIWKATRSRRPLGLAGCGLPLLPERTGI